MLYRKVIFNQSNRSRENLSRGRDFGRDSLGLRDGSELVVSDSCVKGKPSFVLINLVFLFVQLVCFCGDPVHVKML
jgi:hypothetical protein